MTPADQSQGSARRRCLVHVYPACKKWPLRTKYESQKYEKKSPIHENVDAKITCDFGDGDINRSRSRLPHTYIHRYLDYIKIVFLAK